MRRSALFGLLIFSFVTTLYAVAPKEPDRFLETAKKLIQSINSNDAKAIDKSFSAEMRQALPLEKSGPFFRGVVAAKGKLKNAGTPEVTDSTAMVRVTAERGAWDFKITLDSSGKISGLYITPAADEGPTPASSRRFNKVVSAVIKAINSGDAKGISARFDAEMRRALPTEKATAFFRQVLAESGKLKTAGPPKITGDTAIVRVKAERGELDMKITLDSADKISGLYLTPAESEAPESESEKPEAEAVPRSRSSMQLPFRGEWFVFWGGDNKKANYHINVPGQRRAADLIIKGASDRSYKAEGRSNEDYFVYGQEILAAADGTVVTAIDGVPDNEPGTMNPSCPVGNGLIIEQGANEFAVYAHLQPGSLRVKQGDKVQQGQVLGLCGNSGNSSEPHLHFHVQDKATLQDALGITPYFTNVRCERAGSSLADAEYTFLQGDRIQSAGK